MEEVLTRLPEVEACEEFKDGMEEVLRRLPKVEACEEFKEGVATTDVQVGDLVWVRIFRPQLEGKKPVVLYAHGGAYCFGQPNMYPFHAFCASMCWLSNSIWVSLSYRLGPVHRLPAAFDDAALAFKWLILQAKQQLSHPWLTSELADFSNFFFAGESAGASIVLKVARDTAAAIDLLDLGPLCLKGLLLVDPGFHSEEKRGMMVDQDLHIQVEKLYDMVLPEGETLDYAPVNPLHVNAPPLESLAVYPHIFISIADKDFRYNMTMRFYELVRGFCPDVQLYVTPGRSHVFHIFDPLCPEAERLRIRLANFIQAWTAS
ncbi:hypothetical protein GOP47_0004450 [Adiantum capillus-veneris]|uniref:Alpha/beta hydrolase fold-3 domain-containing protein n=1 Tax=Adiantum capillus-veneris TaxID=13818 RepID=A0A9D4V9A8_ADICA|nr:hypothetical protein GOP47_0004450 [Adiantum capillus-veneris]